MASHHWYKRDKAKRMKRDRKIKLQTKAQKAKCLDAIPFILEEIYSFNRQLGMVAQLRSERVK